MKDYNDSDPLIFGQSIQQFRILALVARRVPAAMELPCALVPLFPQNSRINKQSNLLPRLTVKFCSTAMEFGRDF